MSAVAVRPAPDDGRLVVRPTTRGRRRPVLSFVGVLALVALALLAVGRSGVVAPQVELHTDGPVAMNAEPPCYSAYSVVNHGFRPVEVRSVTVSGVRLVPPGTNLQTADSLMTLEPTEDLPLFVPFTVPGGSYRKIVVPLSCTDTGGNLEVSVRSVDLGLWTTLRA
ncbi:MAG TPA: hypothetical protein VK507_09845 [Iamia sp.]|nr:hypothetical protein [Iamia sp.]